MYTHPCIKCSTEYQDEDPDAYYCTACNEERKKIAAEIDKKMGNRSTKPVKSDLQAFEEQAITVKTPDGRTVSFIRASQL